MDTNPEGEVTEGTVESRIEALLTKSAKVEPEKPENQAEAEDETDESPKDEAKEADSDAAPAEVDDSEEVEYEGDVYVMPKKIKEALLRQSDYTKKTQEVAEQRKAVEERAEWLAQQEKLMAAGFEKAVELKEIDARLGQYEQLDWQALVDQDPAQATKLNIAYQQLQRTKQAKVEELQKVSAQQVELTQQERQQALQRGTEVVKKAIPGWSQDLARGISENTKSYGFSSKDLDQLTDPRFVIALHDAYQWRKLQANKSTVSKKVADVRPVTTTARTSTSSQAASKVQDARQALAKSGSREAAENFFEKLLTSRKRA